MFRQVFKEAVRVGAPVAAIGAGAVGLGAVVNANDDVVHPAQYPWSHSGPFSSYDTASIRRGYQVYRQVCASCHSMKFMTYRNLVGVCYTEAEAKALAAEIEVVDGPDDSGNMFERPGKLSDAFPSPYENEEQARDINNGALPPDLSLIAKARHGGEDYLFALLTGYKEAPAGVEADESQGQYYNPYFPGSKIGMPVQVKDGLLEYEDGTPATASQQAKDVSVFLTWAAEPHQDRRKKLGQQFFVGCFMMALLAGWHKRLMWLPIKTRRITYFK